MNSYEEYGISTHLELEFRRQSVESGGDLSYVKGRKVKTMDRGPLRSSHSVEGRVPLLT